MPDYREWTEAERAEFVRTRDAEIAARAALFSEQLIALSGSMTPEAYVGLYARLCGVVEFIAHGGQPEDWTGDYALTSDFARAFSNIILGFFGHDRG